MSGRHLRVAEIKKTFEAGSANMTHLNENTPAEAFSKQAPIFDNLYNNNEIIQYKRERVRSHFLSLLNPNSNILEINAGTGDDAIFFAGEGHHVHATDISEEMQKMLNKKVEASGLQAMISQEICSFNSLELLKDKGPYDAVFSNFAGLNCTDQLSNVIASLDKLLKPGGVATLVILPGFCLWESLMIFKGRFKTATRRFFSGNGRMASIEGEKFKCWYYNPRYIKKHLSPKFSIISIEGLCTLVPPSYLENFPAKHPRLFLFLKRKEAVLKCKWPWRSIGDYYIVSLRKVN